MRRASEVSKQTEVLRRGVKQTTPENLVSTNRDPKHTVLLPSSRLLQSPRRVFTLDSSFLVAHGSCFPSIRLQRIQSRIVGD
jgi:hypothetical protein